MTTHDQLTLTRAHSEVQSVEWWQMGGIQKKEKSLYPNQGIWNNESIQTNLCVLSNVLIIKEEKKKKTK